jgi:hypothetical protein
MLAGPAPAWPFIRTGVVARPTIAREIGSRTDEAPAVRILIGGNIPLEGMRAGPPPALPVPTDSDT